YHPRGSSGSLRAGPRVDAVRHPGPLRRRRLARRDTHLAAPPRRLKLSNTPHPPTFRGREENKWPGNLAAPAPLLPVNVPVGQPWRAAQAPLARAFFLQSGAAEHPRKKSKKCFRPAELLCSISLDSFSKLTKLIEDGMIPANATRTSEKTFR